MKSNRKVCEDYPFRRDEHGMPYLPGGMMMEASSMCCQMESCFHAAAM